MYVYLKAEHNYSTQANMVGLPTKNERKKISLNKEGVEKADPEDLEFANEFG